ncbi:MAG: HNH endonuclease [Gemmataceae bacterium]|nr:HNH endonuclease [Gemmataceae bacterium]
MVLEAFVGLCPLGCVARHFPDRDRANNRLENLQWGTQSQNQADRIFHGTEKRGESCHLAKLTAAAVLAMRGEFDSGLATL